MSSTHKDVAKLAGCSHMTVSRVLRNDPHVSSDMVAKVNAAVKTLGYRRSPMLSAWMTQVRKRVTNESSGTTMAYVTTFSKTEMQKNKYLSADYQESVQRAHSLGFGLDFFQVGSKGLSWRRLTKILDARGIKGVILSTFSSEIGLKVELPWHRLCVVALGDTHNRPQVPSVSRANYDATFHALTQIRQKGYRRIGYVSHRPRADVIMARALGALFEFQTRLDEDEKVPPLHLPNIERQEQLKLLDNWIKQHAVDAIYANEFVLDYLREIGYEVPRDIAFCCVEILNDAPEGEIAGMSRTIFGSMLVDVLAAMLYRNEIGLMNQQAKQVLLEPSFIEGKTLPLKSPRQ